MAGLLSIGIFLLIVVTLAKPTGLYIARAFDYSPTTLDRAFGWLEKPIMALSGIQKTNQTWKQYGLSLVFANAFMILVVYMIFRLQHLLPLNPGNIAAMEPTLAFNTAISFMTNTNLQHYSGESGMSYLAQMLAIVFLMFTAPATTLAAAMAFIRGLAGKPLGNFFVDMIRSITRILLPIAIVTSLLFVSQGVPQTLEPSVTAATMEGAEQHIARGPVGSFLAIKELGNNGGGFFGTNSAHPLENPTNLSNLLQMLLMMLVTTALPFAYGKMVGNRKQGLVLFCAMGVMFLVMIGASLAAESAGNPALGEIGMDSSQGSMEGKEARFGLEASSLYSVVTTASETGAVNTMHDTLTPLGGLVPLANMMLNTIYGGIGAGFMNVLMYAIIAVFIAGLMVGRTPEFLGKKIESREMKLIAIVLLVQPLLILVPSAIALMVYPETVSNPGFHGLTQVLYEFTSSAANNGSGFEGLGDNTPFWNMMTGAVMFFGRYIGVILLLAVAGSLLAKKPVPDSIGTFRTDQPLFGALFAGTVFVVGALTFFPFVVLGPIAEQLTLMP
ncbi:potassium-transporting ATPase subunit KdpA [Paenibacillus sp. NPDC057967]|uniref:potassium-transporting ATPase subunit KdpA n=1 Tax=Paenibacillus sp. NPDC057967 TaxID=3346293 RepID=UPI0036DEE252